MSNNVPQKLIKKEIIEIKTSEEELNKLKTEYMKSNNEINDLSTKIETIKSRQVILYFKICNLCLT